MISDLWTKSTWETIGACLVLSVLLGCSMPDRDGQAATKGSKFKAGDEVYMKLDGKRGIIIGIKVSGTRDAKRVSCVLRVKSESSSTGYEQIQVYEEELTSQKPEEAQK